MPVSIYRADNGCLAIVIVRLCPTWVGFTVILTEALETEDRVINGLSHAHL